VFLSIFAAVLSGIAYAIYLPLVYGGGSIPNPASWTVWAFLAGLNAITFWKGSHDGLATAQFFTGSAGCVAVWGLALSMGKFAPLDAMAWTVLILCLAACLVWWMTRNAVYANLVVGGTLFLSFIPTIVSVWQNGKIEHSLPWYLWTAAFLITSINVFRRTDRTQPRWWFLMVVPIFGTILHGAVALSAAR
jgi:hypothetical protein